MNLCQAIAREEGFGVPFGRATRNNNPGDINFGPFAEAHGATRLETAPPHLEARFAYFPDVSTGFAAMKALLLQHYAGKTISEMLYIYAPPADNNDTEGYIRNVCGWTGETRDTVIDGILG